MSCLENSQLLRDALLWNILHKWGNKYWPTILDLYEIRLWVLPFIPLFLRLHEILEIKFALCQKESKWMVDYYHVGKMFYIKVLHPLKSCIRWNKVKCIHLAIETLWSIQRNPAGQIRELNINLFTYWMDLSVGTFKHSGLSKW